jgi:hypothetical protein
MYVNAYIFLKGASNVAAPVLGSRRTSRATIDEPMIASRVLCVKS